MEHERIYAYHEAGHTVIGYLIGLKFEKVTISSGANSHDDLTGFAGRGAIRRDKTRAGFGKAINIELAFTWAGSVAEVLYCDGFVPGITKGAYGPNRIMQAEGGGYDFAHLASFFELTSKATGHLSALDVKDKAMPPIHDWSWLAS